MLDSDAAPGSETWLGRISAERIDAWAHSRPGERSRLARTLIPRLLDPAALPEDPLPTLRWLLSHADEGLRLTARHYIAPALVLRRSTRSAGGTSWSAPLRQELDGSPAAHPAGHGPGRDGRDPAQPEPAWC